MRTRFPPLTKHYVDRNGHVRFYLRRKGRKDVPLPGLPWSPEFMAAREVALKGEWDLPAAGKIVAGTVEAAVIGYLASDAFAALAESTRAERRRILETLRKDHGPRKAAMPAEALQLILIGKKPGAQRNWRKTLRGLVDYCISVGLMKTDPLAGIKLAKMKKTGGIHAWREEEIARFRERFSPGTRPRLALELLLNTGHARGEVVRMGRQHIDKAGKLSMRRGKTGVAFSIPLLPGLLAELELHPKTSELTFLTTERGRPFKTAASFGTMFKRWCHDASLPHCSTHGLRKASAIRHALQGATAPELMAWHGWKSISEAQRYIEEANRILLSESAAAKLIAAELRTKTDRQVSTPNPG